MIINIGKHVVNTRQEGMKFLTVYAVSTKETVTSHFVRIGGKRCKIYQDGVDNRQFPRYTTLDMNGNYPKKGVKRVVWREITRCIDIDTGVWSTAGELIEYLDEGGKVIDTTYDHMPSMTSDQLHARLYQAIVRLRSTGE